MTVSQFTRLGFLLTASLLINSAAIARAKAPQPKIEDEPERSYNLTINPLWLILGSTDLQFDFGVSKYDSIGVYGGFTFYGIGSSKYTSVGIGARYTRYLGHSRFTDGWYLSPFLGTIPRFLSWSGGSSASSTTFSAGVVIGHQWVFDSGFNMMLGAGLGAGTTQNLLFSSENSVWVLPTGEFRLGYSW